MTRKKRIPTMIGGFRVRVLPPLEVPPRWWEILRRLGLRQPRRVQICPRDQLLVDHKRKAVFVRDDQVDYLGRPGFRYQDGDNRPYWLAQNITEVCHRLRIPPPSKL